MDYYLDYIGKEIRNIRREKKITQEDLAYNCNLSVDTIRRLESGKVDIKLSSLLAVFDSLSIEIYDIFDQRKNSNWSKLEKYFIEIEYYISCQQLKEAREVLIFIESIDMSEIFELNRLRYNQYLKFYKVVLKENLSNDQYISKLIDIIRINHEYFQIEKFAYNSFTKFELRVLRTIANRLRIIGKTDLGFDILLFIESQISEGSKDYPLLTYTISRYCDLDNNFKQAFFWNDKAIKSSIINNDILGLIYSYYQRGDLLIKQKDVKAMDYINMSFELCRLSSRVDLEENLKKYLNHNFK